MQDGPHEPPPQDLTPREWQVFELMRRGFADHQIAQVLGIAEGEAARHAVNTLAKLGMSREEISGWQPAAQTQPQIKRARPAGRGLPGGLKFALGASAIIVVAAVATIAFLVFDSNDRATAPNGDGDQVVDPTATPAAGPVSGDHWHAAYEVNICGEAQPPIQTFPGGVHTHADGFIHIHPFTEEEEGLGATLSKFFEYAGGELTNETIRMPDSRTTFTTGGTCPDGSIAFLQIIVNGAPIDDVTPYIPQDADHIIISLNP